MSLAMVEHTWFEVIVVAVVNTLVVGVNQIFVPLIAVQTIDSNNLLVAEFGSVLSKTMIVVGRIHQMGADIAEVETDLPSTAKTG